MKPLPRDFSSTGIDLKGLATDYYFGDLQYWKLPHMATDALEAAYNGRARLLKKLM